MRYLLILLLALSPAVAHAGEAKDLAEDPVIEKRMVKLAENLRCLVCQNESLASSHAELAEDLRREVREQMKQGKTDQQIIDYLVARYGDFVLFDPPLKSYTLLLWYGPFALLLIGLTGLVIQMRKRKNRIAEPRLSAEDEQRAAALLNPPQDPPKDLQT
jgi:cytochrome c-type biogenesis protein CcmH